MKCKCPFSTIFPNELECVYIKEATDGLCEIDVCPGNSDAWCHKIIDRAIRIQEIIEEE